MKLTPLPPSDVLIHLLLSETIFSSLPLRTAEISSVGGAGIDKMCERRSQAPFEFLQAHFKILTF
jgi:hypothetical protein